ncbi:hypothetical protein C8R32_10582 [Nitrosospira sp. Nsp5]|uniref:Uncharacterized protein n=1 Tax=Nitrosospira multiformis TaxID=1231 RepID=A0ABY0TB07_9PROT|nr:hypothetical protein C8R32_10582 [Nitrosospira sp. Nsp5]SDQ55263.1 hypothetical protein SAMN05216402_1289 [Nitrosospira multiformis]
MPLKNRGFYQNSFRSPRLVLPPHIHDTHRVPRGVDVERGGSSPRRDDQICRVFVSLYGGEPMARKLITLLQHLPQHCYRQQHHKDGKQAILTFFFHYKFTHFLFQLLCADFA